MSDSGFSELFLNSNKASPCPKARIIVVSFNCADYLNQVIEALLQQDEPDFEVVVVDNASDDADRIVLPPGDPRFTLKRMERNVGFAMANNIGARGAAAPWIIALNPDAFPRPDWLRALLTAAERCPEVDMFGSTQLFAHDPGMIDGEGDCYSVFGLAWRANYRRYRDAPYFSGEVFSPCAAAAMYRRTMFEKVGGFDDDFFCYCEDVDLGFRIRLAGGRAMQVGGAVVHHVSSGVSKNYGSFALYHGARNLLWIIVKNVPFPLVLLVWLLYGSVLVYLLLFRWRRRDIGAGLRGIRDGLCGVGRMLGKRAAIQRQRAIGVREVARQMIWNPVRVKTRC